MQVNCPNCGEKLPAENINIQKMTAVCPACDTVFSFDLPADKAKRRKVKQPAQLNLRDDNDRLQMEFWTNFRLERNEAFLTGAVGAFSMTLVSAVLLGLPRMPFVLPLVFIVMALAFFYALALIVVNKTHIEMDEDSIRVTRQPIPNPLNQGSEVPLAGVAAIKFEETALSKKEAYDTPRYQVWAETEDGSRRTIVNDVTVDYAVFIAQHLQERLQMDDDRAVSHLEDDEHRPDENVDMRPVARTSQNKAVR